VNAKRSSVVIVVLLHPDISLPLAQILPAGGGFLTQPVHFRAAEQQARHSESSLHETLTHENVTLASILNGIE
jgi:hypothetical protein